MKYLLIAFVIFVALAPLSHFIPSKRQRKQARLREHAALKGLFVEFRPAPGVGTGGRRSEGEIIYYGLRLPRARRDITPYNASWWRYEDAWRGLTTGHRTVPEPLLAMPGEVQAASVEEGSCGVYWAEAGDESDIDRIVELLNAWALELRPS